MYENLLPVGSVVLLKGANKRLVIVGRIQARAGDRTVYDYSGCPFPEGMEDGEHFYFFNNADIERTYFIGCQDIEELQYREQVLAPLGELYVDENGEIAEREKVQAPADEAPVESVPPAEEAVEAPVFADV